MACAGYDLAVSLEDVAPDVDGIEELDATAVDVGTTDV